MQNRIVFLLGIGCLLCACSGDDNQPQDDSLSDAGSDTAKIYFDAAPGPPTPCLDNCNEIGESKCEAGRISRCQEQDGCRKWGIQDCSSGFCFDTESCAKLSINVWGTSADEQARGMVVTAADELFVTGYTEGDLDGNTNVGGSDILLTKWMADGSKAWTKTWGGPEYDSGYGIAVDTDGNLLIVGNTESELAGHPLEGEIDMFVTKRNPEGGEIWTRTWGSPKEDHAQDVAVDADGAVYVSGYVRGVLDGHPNPEGVEHFVTKWHPDGAKAWTVVSGLVAGAGGQRQLLSAMAMDSSSNIYLVSYTTEYLGGNTDTGNDEIVFMKWNADGNIDWSKTWRGEGSDKPRGISVDANDNVYITGQSRSTQFDESGASSTLGMFLSKCDTEGNRVWTRTWGTWESNRTDYSNMIDFADAIDFDSSGNIYVVGSTSGNLGANVNAGEYDFFASKFSSDGVKLWTKTWGSSGTDGSGSGYRSVAVDSRGQIHVSGKVGAALDDHPYSGEYDCILTTIMPD